MKIVNFSEGQRSEEWHKWRREGIGASDIGVIMGSNTFQTPLMLWEKKCSFREEDPVNLAMKHGIENEHVARQWLNEHMQLSLMPVCVEDPDKPHFKASLDGFDFGQNVLCEIKCPVSEKILDRARIERAVPDYWFDQMQWQIMLSSPARAILAIWDYRHQSCITLDMFANKNRIKLMREKGDEFWERVKIGKPPPLERTDWIDVEGEGLHELLLEYQELSEKGKVLSARKKELKEKIEDFGDDGNFTAYGFKVQRMDAPKRLNLDQMRMNGIDVDKYYQRSESIGYYKISPPKSS